MAVRVHVDETSCGPMCQHPACWQSNTRQDKGFPRLRPRPPSPPDIELDLPTLKVCNMLEDYGEDPLDKFPARYGGKPAHERNDFLSEYHKPLRADSIKVTRAPQTSPKSSSNHIQSPVSAFKVVEVQEVFDPEDLQGTWDDTFVPKSYYVWVPNKKKKRRKKKVSQSEDRSSNRKDKVGVKDMTESMVPKEIEEMRLTSRKKKAQTRSSPIFMRPYTISPRTTMASSKMEFDHDGISELLDLPREILVQVLENTRQSDLMSREKIREVIRHYMPQQFERGNTNISLASQDLLQQKKLNLHEGNKNVRQPQLMETKPVFYLDDDVVDDELEDEDFQKPMSPYGSLKDLYFGGTGNTQELNKYKKPLPAIPGTGRAVSAGGGLVQHKIPSISLGLPELPSGIRQTKPFTYSKKAELDFTLGSSAGSSRRHLSAASLQAPVPTPPTSVRSTETPGSDHGTTIRVNIPSQTSARSERGSDVRRNSLQRSAPEGLQALSPTFSTHVPKAPATTPATNQPHSPTKSAPLLHDSSGLMLDSQDWPPREKLSSPLQILRAPVNTPGSMMQEVTGLGTIAERAPDDTGDQPHPVSRGRSVRFEIPEVPPPPSSPQLSEDGHKDPSRNTVTVNTNVPQETPSNSTIKPMSGATIRTDANTVNTSTLLAENSFVRSQGPPTRELSFISSPEPWPQVNEADYEMAPVPSPNTLVHDSPRTLTTDPSQSDIKSMDLENISKNASSDKEHSATNLEKDGESVKSKGDIMKKTDEAVKRLMEDSMKAESPAPPPPSPEPKQDSNITKKAGKIMTPLLEETETPQTEMEESEMTILQIAPLGSRTGGKKTYNRQIDTFQNIDIPASSYVQPELSTPQNKLPETVNEPIPEEPETEHEVEENKELPDETRDVALSVQSTLANRTISEQAQSEASSPMIEPAISQASQAPALSEDFSERRENSEMFGDWTGMIVGSEGPETIAMLSSDKQDMTEDGGDHEGFKDDLRLEFDRLNQETENNENMAETNNPNENSNENTNTDSENLKVDETTEETDNNENSEKENADDKK